MWSRKERNVEFAGWLWAADDLSTAKKEKQAKRGLPSKSILPLLFLLFDQAGLSVPFVPFYYIFCTGRDSCWLLALRCVALRCVTGCEPCDIKNRKYNNNARSGIIPFEYRVLTVRNNRV